MTYKNLNDIFINDNETESNAIFVSSNNHETTVCKFIESHEVIVGCSMYLTNKKIMETLAISEKPISIIIDKCAMRAIYDKKPGVKKFCEGFYSSFNVFDHTVKYETDIFNKGTLLKIKNNKAVRYIGAANSKKYLHHKFLVGCSINGSEVTPLSVLTGSYNFTENSKLSRENILKICDQKIAKHFFEEWETALVLSEKTCKNDEFKPDLISHLLYKQTITKIQEEEQHLESMIKSYDDSLDADP